MRKMKRYGLILGVAAAAGVPVLWLLLTAENGHATVPAAERLRANGLIRTEFEFRGAQRAGSGEDYVLDGPAGVARIVQVRREDDRDVAVIQAGVVPGAAQLTVHGPGGKRVVADLEVAPDWQDRNRNGFPDSLELSDPADARAFLDWFRFLAEEQYYRGDDLDPEVNDCAALLRYAYREALRRHDGDWAVRVGLKAVKPMPDVTRYHYPFTPLRADLFRLKPGGFERNDLSSGGFGQFADAETLLLYNARPIGKDIGQARPGDLLFYRQDGGQMPFHAMLFLGPSTMEPLAGSQRRMAEYVLYHTGPDGSWRGEMRRPTVAELFHHPEPRWHPSAANPMFLGVYRWKILGQPSMN
jgi:uncharacterized protein YfaT (DUF1175 family)